VRLAEVIAMLDNFDSTSTIYVAGDSASWTGASEAVVGVEDAGGAVPRDDVGMNYFLEVDVACEANPVA
jgi:hypothetical protein